MTGPGKIAFIAALTAIALPANAQTPLELEYEAAQKALNAAIKETVGSIEATTVLPISAFENPLSAEGGPLAVVATQTRLEIKGYSTADESADSEAAYASAGVEHGNLLPVSPESYLPAFGERTQTIAMGALEAANPTVHWVMHGYRFYLTSDAVENEDALREERGLSARASQAHLSQADAFRHNINFSATRAVN